MQKIVFFLRLAAIQSQWTENLDSLITSVATPLLPLKHESVFTVMSSPTLKRKEQPRNVTKHQLQANSNHPK